MLDVTGRRDRRGRSRATTWVALAFWALALLGPAQALAQGLPEGELRVGVILPSAEASDNDLGAAVARAASQGAEMAADEFEFNADMLGIDFGVLTQAASGAEAVVAAAAALQADGAYGIVGGFVAAEAAALAEWSARTGVPFLNVGASADALRGELCQPTVFHIEPSAAMYLDSMAGWYVRSGLRDWYFLHGDDDESRQQLERVNATLRERHFGARAVGEAVVAEGTDLAAVAERVKRARADLVVLLLPAARQLEALSALEQHGVEAMVTGFPYPEAQTRTFYDASRGAAPTLGAGHRISAWEATLDAYGARELNARYRMTYGEPMDAPAWAVYQGVKIFYEAAFFGGSTSADDVLAYLASPNAVFDVWKGIGTSFRPWDGQMRQSIYLVKVDATSETPFTFASLVGELPAIYMPGTEVVERLDQIGDLQGAGGCTRR